MTEISEAAKRKRMELLMKQSPRAPFNPPDVLAVLDRVLQEHSEAAKELDAPNVRLRLDRHQHECLSSIILPDEPCDHLLNVCHLAALDAANPHLCCNKCGKALKIVEADSHD